MPGACLRSTRSCRPPSGLLLEQLLDAIGGAIGDVGGQLRLEQELVRSEEHTSELQSLMRISYAVFCLKKKKQDLWQSQYIAQLSNTTTCNRIKKNVNNKL